jgi:hypothetical protein
MSFRSVKILGSVMRKTAEAYDTPETVLMDPALTADEKKRVLCDIEQDEMEMLRAEEENMGSKNGVSIDGELLERVKNAERILKNCSCKK